MATIETARKELLANPAFVSDASDLYHLLSLMMEGYKRKSKYYAEHCEDIQPQLNRLIEIVQTVEGLEDDTIHVLKFFNDLSELNQKVLSDPNYFDALLSEGEKDRSMVYDRHVTNVYLAIIWIKDLDLYRRLMGPTTVITVTIYLLQR